MPSVAQTIIIPAIKRSTSVWMEWQITTNSIDVGDGTRYPIGFTFDEFVRFFYGIKDYTISASVAGFNDPPFGSDRGCNVSASPTRRVSYRNDNTNPIFAGFTTETEYVTEQRARMFISGEHSIVGPNTAVLLSLIMQPTSGPPDTGFIPVTGWLFGSLYYPELFLSFNFGDASALPPTGGGSIGFSTWFGPLGTALSNGLELNNPTGPYIGSFMGKTLSYQAYSASGLPHTITSSSFAVTSTSWWPYDPGDGGGPCWDSSDGSQLRSDLPGLI
jgi:hypothetical protein